MTVAERVMPVGEDSQSSMPFAGFADTAKNRRPPPAFVTADFHRPPSTFFGVFLEQTGQSHRHSTPSKTANTKANGNNKQPSRTANGSR
jgi:hypothetical protein